MTTGAKNATIVSVKAEIERAKTRALQKGFVVLAFCMPKMGEESKCCMMCL